MNNNETTKKHESVGLIITAAMMEAGMSDDQTVSELPDTIRSLRALIRNHSREAFMEGYAEGYGNGSDDTSRFEWGGGSKNADVRNRERDEAWEQFGS